MKIIDGKDLVNMKFIKTEDGLLKEYKPEGRFVPKIHGKPYWYVDSYGKVNRSYYNLYTDNYIVEHQLVFRTEEECEDYKWFLDQLDRYRYEFTKEEWKDKNINKYHIYYNYDEDSVDVNARSYLDCNITYYFQKRINIIDFINSVGENRIKKYMFDIWE